MTTTRERPLTERQREVLELHRAGMTGYAIAAHLGITGARAYQILARLRELGHVR